MGKNLKIFKDFSAVLLLVIFAFALHSAARRIDIAPISLFLNFIRTSIYVGLFSFWGVTAYRRVVQRSVRTHLVLVSVLMVLWVIIREFKFRFVVDVNAERYLWYSYYLPLLLTPLLALFVSVLLGKSEEYRLPGKYMLMYIPTISLILLFITNDIHQLAFSFPTGANVWSEHGSYSYGIVFYIAAFWGVFCSLAAMIIMIFKSRPGKLRGLFWLPLMPVVLVVAYVFLYVTKAPLIAEQGDIAVFFGITFISFFEICIRLGLIPSNTRYFDLFNASKNLSLQITDNNYEVEYSSGVAVLFAPSDLKIAEKAPLIKDDKIRIHNMPISGGHAIWAEDISELLKQTESLKNARAELADRNEILRLEYEDVKQQKTVEEKNRLYDLLQQVTQTQIDQVHSMANEYTDLSDEAQKQRIIAKIVVIGSYIKRKKDFLLSAQSNSALDAHRLNDAFEESFRSLELLGISGGYTVYVKDGFLPADTIMFLYDFFEDVLEAVIDNINHFNVTVVCMNSSIRVSITFDCADNVEFLLEKYHNASVATEIDGTQIALSIDKGNFV